MKLPIYLDNMATTPLDPRVANVMADCLHDPCLQGNPSSTHLYGKLAAEKIAQARAQVAHLLQVAPREIIWTSGATEANNLAIRGAAYSRAGQGKHIITSALEHHAVLDVCRHLETEGFEITYLSAAPDGRVTAAQVLAAIKPTTILVTIMHVNNEIGTINEIAEIAQLTRAKGIWFHVDAAQSIGKLPLDLSVIPIDLLSFSSHKLYGPKGIGVLFIRLRPKINLTPIVFGGGQEYGLRPGTLATHQIIGLGEACALAAVDLQEEIQRIALLQEYFWQGIQDLPGIRLNGDINARIAHNLNICFAGITKDQLKQHLSDLALSSGSACQAFSTKHSHVLHALKLTPAEIESSRRISLGRFTRQEEIETAITIVRAMYKLCDKI